MFRFTRAGAMERCIMGLLRKSDPETMIRNFKKLDLDKIYENFHKLSYRDTLYKKATNSIFKPNIENKYIYKIVLNDENTKTGKSLYNITMDALSHLWGQKNVNANISEHITQHIKNFNVSNTFGIQGCHFKSFFDGILDLAKKATGKKSIDITDYINQFVENEHFSNVLLRKNSDNTLNLLFHRTGNPPISINNFKMTDIPGSSQLASCSYTCNGKNYVKTVCKDSMLNRIISKLHTSGIPIIQDGTREGEGFFRTMVNHKPNYFFLCDSTLFPVEENTMLNRLGFNAINPVEVPMLSLM